MSHNNSDQVKQCLNHSDSSEKPKESAGGTSHGDFRATHQASCSESGTSRATNQPQCSQPAANQPSQHKPMENGPAHASYSSGVRTEPMGTSNPFSKLNKLQGRLVSMTSHIRNHTVLVDLQCLRDLGCIAPSLGDVFWDASHVKLPHMYQSPVGHQTSHKAHGSHQTPHMTHHVPPSRWNVTQRVLHQLTKGQFSVGDIQTAIMAYNSDYQNKWTFEVLQHYVQRLHKDENNIQTVIPKMAKRALELPDLIKRGIPLLRHHENKAITLSQQQISCLLANAFFCTFPHRNNTKPGSEYANFPTINFSSLFGNHPKDPMKEVQKAQKAEKLRAIFHYFNTVINEDPHQLQGSESDGLVTFERICIDPNSLPKWTNVKKNLRKLFVSAEGTIEEKGTGMLQVDFANKYIGGGVLGTGLVQEEILFLMSPELIVARLFTEKLDYNECLRITGVQMYSLYAGYSRSFEWAGPYHDTTQRDQWRRRYRQIVAIDALEFKEPKDQYKQEKISRELNKAYVGFKGDPGIPPDSLPAIATGNWGCGAFGGDPKLKALIQLMAAAVAERDMAYFTFGDERLARDLQNMYYHLVKNNVTVDKLYKTLVVYWDQTRGRTELYKFIFEKLKISQL